MLQGLSVAQITELLQKASISFAQHKAHTLAGLHCTHDVCPPAPACDAHAPACMLQAYPQLGEGASGELLPALAGSLDAVAAEAFAAARYALFAEAADKRRKLRDTLGAAAQPKHHNEQFVGLPRMCCTARRFGDNKGRPRRRRHGCASAGKQLQECWTRLQLLDAGGSKLFASDEAASGLLSKHLLRTYGAEAADTALLLLVRVRPTCLHLTCFEGALARKRP